MIELLCIVFASACYGVISHLVFHNKKRGDGFFGSQSWKRKYKRNKEGNLYAAPDNDYYKFFGIKYKEAFPWSATALVFITDGFHLFQWVLLKLIFIGFSVEDGVVNWSLFLLMWITWSIVFNIVYVRISKIGINY